MTHYKLRITLENTTMSEVLKIIEKQSGDNPYAYCEEVGHQNERPHTHIYLISDKKEDTIRTQIRKLTSSSRGNSLYSLNKLQFEEGEDYAIKYLAYMLKEGKVVLKGIPEEVRLLAEAHDEKVKEEMKEKRVKQKSKYKRIIADFESKFKEKIENNQLWIPEIIDFVIDFHVREESLCSQATIENYSNTLLIKYIPKYREVLAERVRERLLK